MDGGWGQVDVELCRVADGGVDEEWAALGWLSADVKWDDV